ncbi:MAG: hypothetical protein H8D43_00405 [Chloroflexi bacterium]|nr:hypothetical protein [Chloroflexota bacterium]
MDDNSLHTHTARESCTGLDLDIGVGPGFDFDDRVVDLANKQARLSGLIDRWWDDLSVRQLAEILTIHGRSGVRLGELLGKRRGLGCVGEDPICIDDVIGDLNDKLGRLSRYIDERWPELDSENIKPWSRLVTAYSQNAVRLGQLMGAGRALREEWCYDEEDAALDAALDQLSEEWGIEL